MFYLLKITTMNNIILTTPEQLKAIISEVFANTVPPTSETKDIPDSIDLDTASVFWKSQDFRPLKRKSIS
jgi:hypothetical protein